MTAETITVLHMSDFLYPKNTSSTTSLIYDMRIEKFRLCRHLSRSMNFYPRYQHVRNRATLYHPQSVAAKQNKQKGIFYLRYYCFAFSNSASHNTRLVSKMEIPPNGTQLQTEARKQQTSRPQIRLFNLQVCKMHTQNNIKIYRPGHRPKFFFTHSIQQRDGLLPQSSTLAQRLDPNCGPSVVLPPALLSFGISAHICKPVQTFPDTATAYSHAFTGSPALLPI